MADKPTRSVTEIKAFARGIHMSPRKVRLVVDIVRNMPVNSALAQLDFLGKRAALPVKKLIRSAMANATHNFQAPTEGLYIKSFTVDGGRVTQRFQPRAQGRAFPIKKRTSNLNLILGVKALKSEKSGAQGGARARISRKRSDKDTGAAKA